MGNRITIRTKGTTTKKGQRNCKQKKKKNQPKTNEEKKRGGKKPRSEGKREKKFSGWEKFFKGCARGEGVIG
jgi:hypothetical protein